jgi:hypothetical protein
MLQLLINDKPVDIQGDEEIAVDYAMFDIKDIGSRKGARSYNFNLPLTANNKRVFENPASVDSLGTVVYSKLKARAYVDGLDVGIVSAEVESVSDFITLRLYGSNSNFYSVIANKSLKEIDMSEHNHFWNTQSVFNKRVSTSGVVYPIIDNSYDNSVQVFDDANRRVYSDKLLPALFAHDLLKMIVEYLGYTYLNDMEQELLELGYHLILPASGGDFKNVQNTDIYRGKWGTTQQYPYYLADNLHFDKIVTDPGPYYSRLSAFNDYANAPENYYGIFPQPGKYKVNLHLELYNNFTSNTSAHICLLRGLTGTYPGPSFYLLEEVTLPAGPVTVPVIKDYTVEIDVTEYNEGVTLMPYIFSANPSISPSGLLEALEIGAGSTFEILSYTPYDNVDLRPKFNTIDALVDVNALIPEMKIGEFIKAYCQMFDLMIIVDEQSKTVEFKPFENILSGQVGNAVDWSSKIDLTDLPTLQFVFEEFARTNNCIYKTIEGETPPRGTNTSFSINNENLNDERKFIELPYACTVTSYHLEKSIPHIKVIKGNDSFEPTTQRILLMKHFNASSLSESINYHYNSFNTIAHIDIPYCWFIEEGRQVNLGFEYNLLPRYYQALRQIVANARIISLSLRLTAADINQLDFTRPVYLSQFSSYFYINKIQGFKYTGNDSTMVELVKLNING